MKTAINYISICIILTTISYSCRTVSNRIEYYDITAKPVVMDKTQPQVVILYQQGYCSECTRTLSQYVANICNGTNVKTLILISSKQTDPLTLRSNTDAIQAHLDDIEKGTSFQIVYDLNPIKRKRVVNQFHIKLYPALLLFYENGETEYIPYSILFSDEESYVSSEVLHKLSDFAGVELHLYNMKN